MYKNFTKTADGGFALKKQGMASTIIIGTILLGFSILCLLTYLGNPTNNMLLYTLLMLSFSALIFWRSTKQFIILPQQQIFKYSKGVGVGFTEYRFDELNGQTQENIKNMYGITTGNSFKVGFDKNGSYKEILLGQNISAKKMRSIGEEINAIMLEKG